MCLFPTLRHRVREPEDIDDPALPTDRLQGALRGLATINLLSASAGILWQPIARLARSLHVRRLRVLDIATGAGDVPCSLWRRAQRHGLELAIHGVDANERALEFARQRAAALTAPITFSRLNVLTDALPRGFDVLVSSLFLHHLRDDDAVALLQGMAAAAGQMVLVNDLRRCRVGMLMAHFAGRCLTRSDVVRVDACRSVQAAFTIDEVRALAARAGLESAAIRRRWPGRYLLLWRRPNRDDDLLKPE